MLGVAEAVTTVGTLANTIVDKIFPDADQAQKAELQLMLSQIEVNKVSATNASVFVSGARPAALWVAVVGFAAHILVFPPLTWLATIKNWPVPPTLDVETIMLLLGGLLGLGGFRTYEKVKGVGRDALREPVEKEVGA